MCQNPYLVHYNGIRALSSNPVESNHQLKIFSTMRLVLVVEHYVCEEDEDSSSNDEIIYVDEGDKTTSGVFHVTLEENQYIMSTYTNKCVVLTHNCLKLFLFC